MILWRRSEAKAVYYYYSVGARSKATDVAFTPRLRGYFSEQASEQGERSCEEGLLHGLLQRAQGGAR